MDQYLPGEGDQTIMVLRFLASSGCEEAVMSLIKEKPFIKYFIPPHPPNLSRTEYVKHLATIKPLFSLNFDDLLKDYAKTRIMLSQMIQKFNPSASPLRSLDSLATQLKHLEDVINRRQIPERVLPVTPPEVVKVDVGISTDDQIFTPLPEVETSKNKSMEVDTQTDLISTCDYVEEKDLPGPGLPLMFYNSLISDTSMPQKLATAINEHYADTTSTNEGLPPKVFSQVESEIDRFMLDLLHDEGNDSNSFSSLPSVLQKNSNDGIIQPPNLYDGLSNLFGDADSVINKDGDTPEDKEPEPLLVKSNATGATSVSLIVEATKINSDSSCQPRRQAPVKRITPKRAPTGTPRPHPVFELDGTEAVLITTEKRVVPPPSKHPYKYPYTVTETLPIANNVSSWEMLGRKSIEPKLSNNVTVLPTRSASLTKENVTSSPEKLLKPITRHKPKLKSSKKLQKIETPFRCRISNKRKARLLPPVKLTPEKANAKQHEGPNFFYLSDSKLGTTPTKAIIPSTDTASISQQIIPTPQPPTSLQVPKLVLVTEPISPARPSSSASSSMCKQTSSTFASYNYQTPAADKPEENNLIKLTNLSEVTPILDAFESAIESSELNNIANETDNTDNTTQLKSPKLRGLIASAQKFKATTTQANLYRKSFSTPRKKYVRNLLFDTPPKQAGQRLSSLSSSSGFSASPMEGVTKVRTRSSSNSDVGGISQMDAHPIPPICTPRKRKASSESPDNRVVTSGGQQSISNKKRRNWTQEDTYRSSAFPDRNFSSMQMKENMAQTANMILNVVQNPIINIPSIRVSSPKLNSAPIPTNNGALPLPPIQEELMYVVPPTPSIIVEVVTSPLLEEGEIEDSQSPRIEVDGIGADGEPYSVNVIKSKRVSSIPEPEKFGPENGRTSIKEKRRSSAKEKVPKVKKTAVASNTRGQLLSYELFGTDTDETPVKRKKKDTPVKVTPAKVKLDKIMPNQAKPDKVVPAQVKPDKVKRAQVKADKVKPAKVPAVNVSPVKVVKLPKKVKECDPVLLPFQIIPAPIGFPDPTPVKNNPMMTDFNHDSNFLPHSHFSNLITPMKTSSNHNISPPMLSLPPTPRYILNDPDAMDSTSNSNSNFTMFRSADFLHTPLNTPFKLGPPPTPGRTIILDERSQGAISITMMNQQHYPSASSVSTTLTGCGAGDFSSSPAGNQAVEKPLDLTSPIPPHRATNRAMWLNKTQPQLQAVSAPELSSNTLSVSERVAVQSHVSISRNTPTVIVATSSSFSNSQPSISTSTSMLPPQRAEKKRQAIPSGRNNHLQKILPRPPPLLPSPPVLASVVVPQSTNRETRSPVVSASFKNSTHKSRTPFNRIAHMDVEVNGKHTFLEMSEEKKIITADETNLKSSDDSVDPNKTLGPKPKPVPTTACNRMLKNFNFNRFLLNR